MFPICRSFSFSVCCDVFPMLGKCCLKLIGAVFSLWFAVDWLLTIFAVFWATLSQDSEALNFLFFLKADLLSVFSLRDSCEIFRLKTYCACSFCSTLPEPK